MNEIDSAAIQEGVKTVWTFGSQFLPPYLKIFSALIGGLLTAATAAIIRTIEKKKIDARHRADLQAETEILNKRIETLKKENP